MIKMSGDRDERIAENDDRDVEPNVGFFGPVHSRFTWDDDDLPGLIWVDDENDDEMETGSGTD